MEKETFLGAVTGGVQELCHSAFAAVVAAKGNEWWLERDWLGEHLPAAPAHLPLVELRAQ